MCLTTPPAIRMLQRNLYVKAKTELTYPFYRCMTRSIERTSWRTHAYALARANRGEPGVDGVDLPPLIRHVE
jgi:RNA-directed DNA polymerase